MKSRHFWFGVFTLLLLVSFMVGGVVSTARNGRNDYMCLRFGSDRPDADYLFDIRSGFYTYDSRPITLTQLPFVMKQWPSPKSGRIAYVRPVRAAAVLHALYVKPTTQNIVTFEDDEGAAILETSVNMLDFAWAPDGQRVAYIYDVGGQITLTIANANGESKINTPISTPRPNDVLLYGWSADGRYVAVGTNGTYGRQITFFTAANLASFAFPLYTVSAYIENVTWSSVGHRLSYLRIDHVNRAELVVATPGGAELSLSLPTQLSNTRLFWSPDSQYLVIRYADGQLNWQLAVFRVSDSEITQSTEIPQGSRILWPQGSTWSKDGKSIIYWREKRPNGRDLVAYDLATATTRTIVENAVVGASDPLTDGEGRMLSRVAVSWREAKGTLSLDLMDVEGANRVALVREASAINQVTWSPDRQRVLVDWTVRKGAETAALFSWSYADGRMQRLLEGTDSDFEKLIWLLGGNQMAYTARQDGRISVEVIDLETNRRVRLADNFAAVDALTQNITTGDILFWWRDTANRAGVDAYRPDGTRVYRFLAVANSIQDGRNYPAPTGNLSVLVIGSPGAKLLQLANAENTRVLRTSLYTTGTQRWAPDGSRFAILYTDAMNQFGKLEIFSATGESIRHFDQPVDPLQSLTWTRCN